MVVASNHRYRFCGTDEIRNDKEHGGIIRPEHHQHFLPLRAPELHMTQSNLHPLHTSLELLLHCSKLLVSLVFSVFDAPVLASL